MMIVTADDWGRSSAETNAAAICHAAKRITTVSAMVFMEDSERAAAMAHIHQIDCGLHINLTQPFTGVVDDERLIESQRRINQFLGTSRYAGMVYHPGLRGDFRHVVLAQFDEFRRLYGAAPSHVDGHHHQHLCMNLLLEPLIAPDSAVRRSFSFSVGEKSSWNIAYRQGVDAWLARRYRITEFFFALAPLLRQQRMEEVGELALWHSVELMAHPLVRNEFEYLLSGECGALFARLPMASHLPE